MPRDPAVYSSYLETLRRQPSWVPVLARVWNWQLAHARGPTWSEARTFPLHLEMLVRAGFLVHDTAQTYLVVPQNDGLIEALHVVSDEMARAAAAARAERIRQEAAQRAELERQESARRETEARAMAEEAERRRQAEQQDRARAERERVWREGNPLDVAELFGTNDEVIGHLISRGFSRRHIVGALGVGEHRVTRIRKRAAGDRTQG